MATNITTSRTTADEILGRLQAIALQEVPEAYLDNEDVATAWAAQRVLELAQEERHAIFTVQALLCIWVVNGDQGQVWMNHPNGYGSFRDFLKDVGGNNDDRKLAPSTISDMCTIAEIIVPFCEFHSIDIAQYVTSDLWPKFQEVIPTIRAMVAEEDIAGIREVLEDVVNLPTRDAVRAKYRKSRNNIVAVGDVVSKNGQSAVLIIVPTADVAAIKGAVGRYVDWQTISMAEFSPGKLSLTAVSDELH